MLTKENDQNRRSATPSIASTSPRRHNHRSRSVRTVAAHRPRDSASDNRGCSVIIFIRLTSTGRRSVRGCVPTLERGNDRSRRTLAREKNTFLPLCSSRTRQPRTKKGATVRSRRAPGARLTRQDGRINACRSCLSWSFPPVRPAGCGPCPPRCGCWPPDYRDQRRLN